MSAPRVSFILPSFHKASLFEKTWEHNKRVFVENDAEVVICVDDLYDERWYVKFANGCGVRMRVLCCDKEHPWRNPAVPMNVGVRHSEAPYLCFMSPETILELPPGGFLTQIASQTTINGGLLWNVANLTAWMRPYDVVGLYQHAQVTASPGAPGYGLLLCPRSAFEAISGFDESRTTYGKDDDCIRIRLIRYGLRWVIDSRIRVYHLWHEGDHRNKPEERQCVNRNVMLDHQSDWGQREQWRVAWDWRTA